MARRCARASGRGAATRRPVGTAFTENERGRTSGGDVRFNTPKWEAVIAVFSWISHGSSRLSRTANEISSNNNKITQGKKKANLGVPFCEWSLKLNSILESIDHFSSCFCLLFLLRSGEENSHVNKYNHYLFSAQWFTRISFLFFWAKIKFVRFELSVVSQPLKCVCKWAKKDWIAFNLSSFYS